MATVKTDLNANPASVVPFLPRADIPRSSVQEAIEYISGLLEATNLAFAGDSGGNLSIDLDTETLTLAGGVGIATVGSGNGITFNTTGVLEDLVTLGAPASDGQFIVATGAGAFAYESGSTARASLGLIIGTDVQAYSSVLANTTASFTTTDEAKLDYITVTQAVDLDTIEARVNELDAAVVLKGGWDASSGSFPGAGAAQSGWSYIVTVAGTVDGVAFSINDRLLAYADNASTTTYAANWLKLDYTDQVLSVDGQTGAVNLSAVYQPLDADLTAIAALTTNAAGLSTLTLTDPGADRLTFWDDSAGAMAHGTPTNGLEISGTSVQVTSNQRQAEIVFLIDGGGSAITTGVKGYIEVPFACTITQATALADQSGSIVVDIWKDTYANYPPVDADSITASAPVTISSATKAQDATLTGWTTSVSAGDILGFNVDSASTVTRVTIALKVTKT